MVGVQADLVGMVGTAAVKEVRAAEVERAAGVTVADVADTRQETVATVEKERDAKAYTSPSYEKHSRSNPHSEFAVSADLRRTPALTPVLTPALTLALLWCDVERMRFRQDFDSKHHQITCQNCRTLLNKCTCHTRLPMTRMDARCYSNCQ